MPNFSGVWTLKEHGVAIKGDRWQAPLDVTSRLLRFGGRLTGGSGNDIVDIRFVTIATLGNEADFGDLTVGRSHFGALSNATRAVAGGGYNGSSATNIMDYVNRIQLQQVMQQTLEI